MSEQTQNYSWMTDTRYMGPAQVLDIDDSGTYIYLRLEREFTAETIKARLAIPQPCILYPGDTVLAMGEDIENIFVIGVINQGTRMKADSHRIMLENGTHAEVFCNHKKQAIQVFSHKRELLFEYDEKNGKARINLENGDIEFVTRKGNINFVAGKDIMLNGQTVGITGRSGILMGILDKLGELKSVFSQNSDSMEMHSPKISVRAKKGDVQINDTMISGNKLSANIDSAKLMINRLETVSQTVISKAKNMYNTIDQLSQVKTGRMRFLIENTFHMKSHKTVMKSNDDFKINAKKIHLG